MAEGSSYKAAPGGVRLFISSNKGGKSTDVTAGIIDFRYFESILSDTISVQATFIDSGGSTDGQSVLDGLPIVGGERCAFQITDLNDVSVSDVPLYVNMVNPISDDNRGQVVQVELRSKEFFLDDKIRLKKKFTGKISESVTDILSNAEYGLGTDKVLVDFEETINNLNFMGNMKKPFYTINWLAKKSVPGSSSDALGNTAGFFFWEASLGYHFRSIDTMMDKKKNEPKRSIIYTNTEDELGAKTPKKYTTKALEFNTNVPTNVSNRQKVGTNQTKMVLFDPFNCYYEVVYNNSFSNQSGYTSSGEELVPTQPEFDTPATTSFSRTTYYLLDKGTLPDGSTEQQLEKSKEENFEYSKILNQSIMRYNQFFGYQVEVTIPGDFELHAGDMVFVDSAEKKDVNSGDVNQNSGGLYIISELCHFLSTKGTYTRLNLVRDSVGRTGRPTA